MGNCTGKSAKKDGLEHSHRLSIYKNIGDVMKNPNIDNKNSKNRRGSTTDISLKDLIISDRGFEKDYTFFAEPIHVSKNYVIKKAIDNESKKIRAIKIVNKIDLTLTDRNKMLKEVLVLKKLDHINIVKIHAFYESKKYFYIVRDYSEGADLLSVLSKKKFILTEASVRKIMRQLLSAVAYLHNNFIVHRNLYTDKLIYDVDHIVLFGFERISNEDDLSSSIDMSYRPHAMAPETFDGVNDEKSDIWACGVIMYELCTGVAPFQGKLQEIKKAVKTGNFTIPIQDIKYLSVECKEVLRMLLTVDSVHRPAALTILEHRWFKLKITNSKSLEILDEAIQNMPNLSFKTQVQTSLYQYFINQISTQDELHRIAKQFELLDTNKDGTINKDEIREYMSRMDNKFTDAEIGEIFDKIDIDKNGLISYSEFLIAMSDREKLINEVNITNVFKMFDKKGEGKICIKEFITTCSSIACFADTDWNELIDDIDTNRDGYIDFYEFKNYIEMTL